MQHNFQKTPISGRALVSRAANSFPELQISSLEFYAANDHILYVTGHDGTPFTHGNAYVALDLRTGDVLQVYHQARSGLVARLIDTVDVLHFGTFAGLWSQFLYFVFGVFLSGLTLTGAYLQVKRQERRHGTHRLRVPVVTAYAVTIVLLLVAATAGWSEITSYDADGGWPKTNLSAVIFVLV